MPAPRSTSQPPGADAALSRGVAVLAAALLGLGAIFWVAAHWAALGRIGQFALLQALVAAAGLAGALAPRVRTALLLLALLAQGGLLAYFGQTYQTGADPWQLFAWWAALGLPLALAARSDGVWAPWALVCAVAVSLWMYTQQGRQWTGDQAEVLVQLAGWGIMLALGAALSAWPPLQRFTGAGPWGFRSAVILACVLVGLTGLSALFAHAVRPAYWLALSMLGLAAFAMVRARLHDLHALSALGLVIDTLLVCGLGRLLLAGLDQDAFAAFLLLGLAAAGLVAATVAFILKLGHGTDTDTDTDTGTGTGTSARVEPETRP